jgi:hypothetical protein
MSGQASQLSRKEATSLQKRCEMGNKSGATGNGGDPECHSQKGVKANPTSAKG